MRWFMPRFASNLTELVEPEGSEPSVLTGLLSGHIPSPADALRHFQYPSVTIPPSARVGDPKLKQRENEPMKLWHLWKYGAFVAVKATAIAADVLSHQLWGPRRKSWGLEMTLLSSAMRGIGQWSYLADITTIRMVMSIGGLVPVPSDALVTPVTFQVRKRKLRGILAEFDAVEDGKRELSGEWVVGRKTWKRLQDEWRARKQRKSSGAAPSKGKRKERVVMYLHGGAYYMFSAATHRLLTIPLAKYLDARLFAVDYRLAPETRFPGPLHDVVSTYFRLVDDLRVPPENIILAGDSAGGALVLALLMYLRDNDYPLPSGAIAFSPWVDLTMSCESWESNADYDIIPMPAPGDHMNPIACYLGEHMEKYLTHPYASPLFGDFKGLPPLLIQAGEAEVLRDEITLLAHKATLVGVEVRHELYEDMVHVFQSIPFLDASKRAFVSCHDFVWNFLPRYQSRTPQHFESSAEEVLEDEIVSDATRVVRGDGTETGEGRDAISDSAEEKPSYHQKHPRLLSSMSSSEDPSWGSMYVPSSSDDEGDFGDGVVRTQPTYSTPSAPVSAAPVVGQRPGLVKAPSFPRLRATVSAIADVASASASSTLHLSRPHSPLSPSPPSPARRRGRISSISMTSSSDAAPKPAIRRSRRSHPDITSLCQQWSTSGPANQTTTFKADSPTFNSVDQKHQTPARS